MSEMYHPQLDAEYDLDNPYRKTFAEEAFATIVSYNLANFDKNTGEYIGDVTPMYIVERGDHSTICMRLKDVGLSDKHVAKQMIFGDQKINVEKEAVKVPFVMVLQYAEPGYVDNPDELDADELEWKPAVFLAIDTATEDPTFTVLDAQTGRELTDEEVLIATKRLRAIRSYLTAEFMAEAFSVEVVASFLGEEDAEPEFDEFGNKDFDFGSYLLHNRCLICGGPYITCEHVVGIGSVN